ncbi:hypothetical protein BC827DRAFT_523224 [Russula dissimulans]|nr:hypothetical protein BC827DRAFT_523224 [Russula dissimulans]
MYQSRRTSDLRLDQLRRNARHAHRNKFDLVNTYKHPSSRYFIDLPTKPSSPTTARARHNIKAPKHSLFHSLLDIFPLPLSLIHRLVSLAIQLFNIQGRTSSALAYTPFLDAADATHSRYLQNSIIGTQSSILYLLYYKTLWFFTRVVIGQDRQS